MDNCDTIFMNYVFKIYVGYNSIEKNYAKREDYMGGGGILTM